VWEAVFVEGLVTDTVWKIADVAAVEPAIEIVCVTSRPWFPALGLHWIAMQVVVGQFEVAASKVGA